MATKLKEVINIFKNYINIIINCNLFKGINKNDLIHMLNCMNPKVIQFNSNSIITYPDEKLNEIGIILEGNIEISKDKKNGTKIIINKLYKGDIFGELVAFSSIKHPYLTITSNTKSKILFLKVSKIENICSKNCTMHNVLISNIIQELANKAMLLNSKVHYLSIKSIRSKLCTFLYEKHLKLNKTEFDILLNRNELAEFLNVSRPSMSRELGKLKNEKILIFKSNHFKLLNINKLVDYVE